MSQLGKRGFPDPTLAQRPRCLQRFDLRQHHDGKGVGVAQQLSLVLGQVAQLADGEPELALTAPKRLLEPIGFPSRVFVRQDGQAGHGTLVALTNPRVVIEHPARKLRIALGLHFDMQEHPLLAALPGQHLHQHVHAAPAEFRAADDFLEFLAEQLDAFAPVDLPGNPRKAKFQRRLEVGFQDVLPWTVVIGLQGRRAVRRWAVGAPK